MNASNKIVENPCFGQLTDKQKEVLDLLVQHKTSKEIAREIGVSPHTVDQRINFSKKKLQVNSRGELALAYRRLKAIYEPTIYQKSHIETDTIFMNGSGTDGLSEYLLEKHPRTLNSCSDDSREVDYQVVPEMFEGPHGKRIRVLATVGIAALMIILLLGSLTIFSEVSDLLSRWVA